MHDHESAPATTMAEPKRAIEAILLVSSEPTPAAELAQLLELPVEVVDGLCRELALGYDLAGHGFQLVEVAGGWRYQTHPDMAPYVERFAMDGVSSRLSSAALETLSIVAYKQPISRAQVSAIRGVNVDAVLRTLVQRGYVEEVGRDTGVGQAILYGTTRFFLERLGLNDTSDLPALGDFVPSAEVVEALEQTLKVELEPLGDPEVEAATEAEPAEEADTLSGEVPPEGPAEPAEAAELPEQVADPVEVEVEAEAVEVEVEAEAVEAEVEAEAVEVEVDADPAEPVEAEAVAAEADVVVESAGPVAAGVRTASTESEPEAEDVIGAVTAAWSAVEAAGAATPDEADQSLPPLDDAETATAQAAPEPPPSGRPDSPPENPGGAPVEGQVEDEIGEIVIDLRDLPEPAPATTDHDSDPAHGTAPAQESVDIDLTEDELPVSDATAVPDRLQSRVEVVSLDAVLTRPVESTVVEPAPEPGPAPTSPQAEPAPEPAPAPAPPSPQAEAVAAPEPAPAPSSPQAEPAPAPPSPQAEAVATPTGHAESEPEIAVGPEGHTATGTDHDAMSEADAGTEPGPSPVPVAETVVDDDH